MVFYFNFYKSLLHHFISNGDIDQLSILLEEGADTSTPQCKNIIPPLHYAIKLKQNECISILLQSDNNVALELLLENNADPNIPNSKGDRPIYYAIHQHNPQALSLLISNGARINYESIKYSIELDDIECLFELFKGIYQNQSLIEFEDLNESTLSTSETISVSESDRETINNMIKQLLKKGLHLARRLDRPLIELYLSLSPIKFKSIEEKEFVEKLHQVLFSNLKKLDEQLNNNEFISSHLSSNNNNRDNALGISLIQPKRKSLSVSKISSSQKSDSEEQVFNKQIHFANEYSSSTATVDIYSSNTEENDKQTNDDLNSNEFKSLIFFTHKIYSSIHQINLYFRVLNTKSKSLKNELKELELKLKEKEEQTEKDLIINEIGALWLAQINKSQNLIKDLNQDVISTKGLDSINNWMETIQQRKEYIKNFLGKDIEENEANNDEEKKIKISETLQVIRKLLKNRDDHEFISHLVSSYKSFHELCETNVPVSPPKFKELINLIEKEISELPPIPTTKARRQTRGRISTNIIQIITDKDKL